MNTGTFRSSIDWSHEIVNSLLWISIAFVIAAPCLLLALVVIARTTEWGRQFWRVTGGYFTGRQSMVVWTVLALLLVFTIITVRISVLISFYTNDVFTSLQVALQGVATDKSAVTDSGIHGFWVTIGIFLILAVIHVIVTLLDIYVTQRFIMRWRVWLSGRLIDDWLGDFAYYRRQFLRQPNDNPDQRIQQDIDIFTTGVGGQTNNPMYDSGTTLLFGGVAAMLSVFAFGAILWRLSGPLTLGGVDASARPVLDSHRLCAGRHRRRLRHRQAADPAELPQRAAQRGLPLCAGAGQGRQRGDRAVPRRERRAPPAGHQACRGDGQLRRLAEPHGALQGLEPDGEPGDQPAAVRRAGAAAFRTARSRSATSSSRRPPSPRSTTRCRSSGRPTTSSRATARR